MYRAREWITILAATAAALVSSGSTWTEDGLDDVDDADAYNDTYMALRYDYVVNIQSSELNNFLKYDGSKLFPVTKLAISYKYAPRNQEDKVAAPQHYEDLWYSQAAPVGCRRYAPLNISPGSKGAIFLSNTNSNNPFAAANAAIRIILDSNLLRSNCSVVIVPREMFEAVSSAFGTFGFYRVTVAPESRYPGIISLTLLSKPPGQARQFVFEDWRSQ